MKYQVIARKFRPQVFEQVVGQKPIVQTLQNAIQMGRIGHAYLFSGPRGVGKTTTARLLAKGLNCAQGPTITPCNQCPSCLEIASGQCLDVLEIDAASNTGVDNIRELRENARYAPSRDRFKIFIIDEVHMLSTSAFNALLKILEEPPSHVVFIMATTERHKLPATILSRCQQFVFRTISAPEIQGHLRQIADREGVQIDDRALSYIVRASEGSMRDAQSLLDQIISFGGQKVADADVRDVLGFIPNEILDQTVDGVAEHDSKALLDIIDIVINQGLNIQQYVREFIACLRDLLLMKLDLDAKVLGSPEEKAALKQRAQRFSEQDLIRYFDLTLRLENDLRYTSQPRFHLEVGFIKLAKLGHLRDIEEVISELRQGNIPAGPTAPAAPSPRVPPVVPTAPAKTSSVPLPPLPTKPAPKPFTPPTPPPKQSMSASAPPSAPPASGGFRESFIRRAEDRSPTTTVYLQKADRIERNGDRVEIVMPNSAYHSALDTKEHRTVIDAVAAELVGKPVSVSLIIKGQTSSGRNDSETTSAIESAREEPLVKRFLEVFRGDLAQVKPAKAGGPDVD
jgi:DNA polymerase-3 subunit gamma/tau